ncbi:MAG: flagellar basal body-associated FliL family protein [Novosphingobium sp.]
MSDKTDKTTEAKPKKGKGLVIKMLMATTLLGAGGGGAFALMRSGMIGDHGGGHAKEDNNPKLIRKGEEDTYAPKGGEGKEGGDEMLEVMGGGGSEYRTAYYVFADDFTSNLKNSDGMVQVSLAAATRRDGRVLLWMKKHELAIRSSMLSVLADTPEEEVYTLPGKEHMQKRLTDSINKVLTEREGFGGVDNVYFKTFLVQ